MAAPKRFPYTFRNIYLHKGDCAGFVCSYDKEASVSSIIAWNQGAWASQVSIKADAAAFAISPYINKPIILSKEGQIFVWQGSKEGGGCIPESIDASDYGPQHYGVLLDLKIIENTPYVCGMARSVYRQEPDLSWTALDKNIRSEDGEDDRGFFSIDGFSREEIYAVGVDGEIARYDGNKWEFIDSPTNVILQHVHCAANGLVYACGQGGVLIEGRNNNWRVIDHKETGETLWCTAWFKDSLYLSSSEGIYRLVDDQLIALDVQMQNKKNILQKGLSFYRLATKDSVLWSVGPKMAMWSSDGILWNEIKYG